MALCSKKLRKPPNMGSFTIGTAPTKSGSTRSSLGGDFAPSKPWSKSTKDIRSAGGNGGFTQEVEMKRTN